ncbi:DUF664 domain-containing protein [Streptomyces sp. 9-7]|uniref:DUF664 domain-containing protein n=1 Tax=Streptomyces siderophoricus TaxID=2802281 RepID=A0ABS1MSA1_9ACTN|nr:DUF664 domain-containing protein [Streptomyces sp. 9-7]
MSSNERVTREPAEGPTAVTGERAEWLEALAKHRHFLRFTTRDLTEEQLRLRTTASELCLGGLIKHVTAVERNWVDFILNGPSAMPDFTASKHPDPAWARRDSGPSPGCALRSAVGDARPAPSGGMTGPS